MRKIEASELILNDDGSIYHLCLKPGQVAQTVITVGDPDRVAKVTKHFDTLEYSIHHREFITETGSYKGKRFTVISSGIGTDNIDIVLNEIDAVVNIDFDTRTVKKNLKSLDIVRIGTSGSIQEDIPVDSLLISEYGLGLDCMLQAYDCEDIFEKDIVEAFIEHSNWNEKRGIPYIVQGNTDLLNKMKSNQTKIGCTATMNGFYGPQSRVLRIPVKDQILNEKMSDFNYNGIRITNLEMETASIYGLSKKLGHRALSMNAILANRVQGTFSKNPSALVEKLILYTLDKLAA
ncbi:MAG: nucleoside phosphorylase [Flavobacteriaceae bacterium]|nr:nucleoside phosphorylase [Flavobacteriaceae bacterium]